MIVAVLGFYTDYNTYLPWHSFSIRIFNCASLSQCRARFDLEVSKKPFTRAPYFSAYRTSPFDLLLSVLSFSLYFYFIKIY